VEDDLGETPVGLFLLYIRDDHGAALAHLLGLGRLQRNDMCLDCVSARMVVEAFDVKKAGGGRRSGESPQNLILERSGDRWGCSGQRGEEQPIRGEVAGSGETADLEVVQRVVIVCDDEDDMEHSQRGLFSCNWSEPILGPCFLPRRLEEDFGGRTMDIMILHIDVGGVQRG